jgi:hypothetical protein
LAHYHEEDDNFLQWVITGDETWVYHYQAEENAVEAFVISCCKEIQDATISRQVDVDHLLGFSRAYS